jgi:hypothetical protein
LATDLLPDSVLPPTKYNTYGKLGKLFLRQDAKRENIYHSKTCQPHRSALYSAIEGENEMNPEKMIEKFGNETESEKMVTLDDYLNCYICGASLDFEHHADFAKLVVYEKANCPCCGVRMKTKTFTLH